MLRGGGLGGCSQFRKCVLRRLVEIGDTAFVSGWVMGHGVSFRWGCFDGGVISMVARNLTESARRRTLRNAGANGV